ncbi:MAG: hypothetical protein J6V32_02420 [Elusimicrobiaceae bacterium]|nr:hypothetical protein [Elusimicrobiaceae bacterium]
MNKKLWGLVAVGGLVFAAGLVTMRVWDSYHLAHTSEVSSLPEPVRTDSIAVVNMETGVVPQGLVDAEEPENQVKELTVPSQLAKIDMPEIETILSRSGEVIAVPENTTKTFPSVPQHGPQTAYPAGEPKAAPLPQDSKISMISAPVEAIWIKSLEEYRQFKRRARGSYPTVDFKKQQVLVLESASNLPDKAFEIVSVNEENGKRVVEYRVNVFGLDKKTNTHSVMILTKKDLPLELRQVL